MDGAAPGALLVGRAHELDVVEECLGATRAGTACVLLVGGDAGIGKSTLVRAAVARARETGFTVLEGHCLDLAAGIPFGPFVEAIGPLLTDAGNFQNRPATRRVASLLDPARATHNREWSTLLTDLLQVVDEAVSQGPVLLVLEDLHWVERSTQDLALMLARTASGSLLLLLTFRTDELTRRHPFRVALVEVARSDGVRRVELAPLDEDGIRQIVEGRSGRPTGRQRVQELLARSEGNPLYVEELLTAGAGELPGQLGDLFLARVDALGAPTRSLLQVASVGGSRIDPELVGDVAQVGSETRDELWREAVDANLVVRAHDYLEFRHGLLREAVYDDLLPTRRRALHAGFAATLEARVASSPTTSDVAALSQVAFHWHAAREQPAAFAASERAGMAAGRYGAAGAITHFERALELWGRVPDPESLGGLARADLLLLLGEAVGRHGGDLSRWKALVEEAVRSLEPGGDRLLATRVYSARAR